MSRGAALLLLLVPLTGCALLGPSAVERPQTWDSRRAELSALDRWSLQARVASSVSGWTGNMIWRQQAEKFDVRVSGPLGVGAFQVQGDPTQAEVRTTRERFLTGDPEAYIRDNTGWTLPIRGLRYWAMGLPTPDHPSEMKLDTQGRLAELQQDGWKLQYSEYERYAGHELPKRFTLDNGQVHIRVVVDNWSDLG